VKRSSVHRHAPIKLAEESLTISSLEELPNAKSVATDPRWRRNHSAS
jgi:hypothetical protein